MKTVKILSFVAIASLALACNKQNYPAFEYGPKDADSKTEVYFPVTAVAEELEPDANEYVINVVRSESTDALSVPVSVYDPAGVFGVPATIEFAAGEAATTLVVDITKMELETDYEFTISLPTDYYYLYKTDAPNSTKNSFHFAGLKQKWNDAGDCVFYDWTWFDDVVTAEGKVAIQNHEGTDDYRIVKPYATIIETDGNIVFTLKDNEISFAKGISDFWPGTGYYFYWDTSSYGAYCNFDDYVFNDDGSVSVGVNFLLAVGTTPSYICWFGFDWYNSPITKPENK